MGESTSHNVGARAKRWPPPPHSMVKTTSLRILHSAINRVRILAHRFAKWPERPRVGRFNDREACSVPLQPYLSKAPGRPCGR